MSEEKRHIANFSFWCKKCKYKDKSEFDDKAPCYDCLNYPVIDGSNRPMMFVEKKDISKTSKKSSPKKLVI